jgi:NodT family efflux transporter outer membrane factor (OMF) lipoprotein
MHAAAARPRAHSRRFLTGRTLGCVLLAGTLSACAVGPNYHRPPARVAPAFKENQGWLPATPRQIPVGQPWWSIYNDPVLDALERQVVVSNQTLKASEAAYRAAQQVVAADRGTLFPDLQVTGSATRTGEAGGVLRANSGTTGTSSTAGFQPPSYLHQTTINVGAQASWTIDVWGRIRRLIESDTDRAQASAADVAGALLSAQVALAQDYFQLRAAEQERRIYETYLSDLENALEIAQNQVRAGVTTLADVYQAQTQLENTQVADINVELTRATYEHAIATLIGKPPAELSIPQGPFKTTVPVVPVGVPSELLERRPDIAAAERTMAAENALIGVSEAAWFPSLTLTGNAGYTANTLTKLIRSSTSLWSFGPSVAETVFNGGARLAQMRQARANYDQAVANYRETVLSAFQAVENDLVTLRVLERSDGLQVTAVGAARLSEQLTLNQYKAGIVAFTSVITAQTTRLASEISLLALQNQQRVASVDLISQIGGGWNAAELRQRGRGVPADGLVPTRYAKGAK